MLSIGLAYKKVPMKKEERRGSIYRDVQESRVVAWCQQAVIRHLYSTNLASTSSGANDWMTNRFTADFTADTGCRQNTRTMHAANCLL